MARQQRQFKIRNGDLGNDGRIPNTILESPDYQDAADLDLSGCSGLEELPDLFPLGVTHVNLSACNNIKYLPSNTGSLLHLTHLNLDGCTGLERLTLPPNIAYLSAHRYPLGDLPPLPPSITNVILCDSQIKSLPLPELAESKIQFLDLSNCAELRLTPEIEEILNEVTLRNVPDNSKHQSRVLNWGNRENRIKATLKLAINSYREANPNKTEPNAIKTLISDNRLLDQSLAIETLVKFLTKIPNEIEPLNNIAAAHLNQPVKGLTLMTDRMVNAVLNRIDTPSTQMESKNVRHLTTDQQPSQWQSR